MNPIVAGVLLKILGQIPTAIPKFSSGDVPGGIGSLLKPILGEKVLLILEPFFRKKK